MRDAALFIAGQERVPSGLLSSISARFARLYRTWRNRRQVADLTNLDDHVLADLGLTRGDVMVALSARFSQDPSSELQRIALANRSRWVRV